MPLKPILIDNRGENEINCIVRIVRTAAKKVKNIVKYVGINLF